MKVKKIISLALCAIVTVNMLVSSVSASSYSGTEESRVYTYNGYTVEYKVVNEWTGNQNIEIVVGMKSLQIGPWDIMPVEKSMVYGMHKFMPSRTLSIF